MTFGERLRELRQSLGMSADNFAKAIGVGKATLSSYETDIVYPSLAKVVKMLKVLELTAGEFFKGVDLY